MYRYNYRISDHFDKPVVSLAILADLNKKWRPSSYHCETWGCSTDFKYPVVKLADFKKSNLLKRFSENPYAVITYAHLKAKHAGNGNDNEKKFATKHSIIKALFKNGYPKSEISDILFFIDWIFNLPDELEQKFKLEVRKDETGKEAKEMISKYSISQEFADIKKKFQKEKDKKDKALASQRSAIIEILSNRLGKLPTEVYANIEKVDNLESLKRLTLKAALTDCIQDFIDLLNEILVTHKPKIKTRKKQPKTTPT